MAGSIPPSLEWIGGAGRKCVPPGQKKVGPAISRGSRPSSIRPIRQSVNHGESEFFEFSENVKIQYVFESVVCGGVLEFGKAGIEEK